jgi:predicted phage tail protein
VIAAYERQRQAHFVNLISPNILLSSEVKSFNDFARLSDGPLGQMSQSEVMALASYLEARGVYLRYVSKDLRRAVIFGDVPSLVNVPAAPLNDGNFVAIQDASAGATKVGSGTIGLGTVIISVSVALASPAVVAVAGEGTLLIGAGIVALGAGLLVGWGIVEILNDSPPPPKQPSSDSTDFPNEVNDENAGDIEVANAVAIGSPDNGIDVEVMVDQLATGILDEVMSSVPIGWDSASGSSLPGIGDLGGTGDDSGGGLGSGFGFG